MKYRGEIMTKIGIISDTHNVLRDEVINDLTTCDYIIHAGDIIKQDIVDALKKIAPLYIVKGNNDVLNLNEELRFEIEGYKIFLIHQKGEKQDVDFYIYGHSHQYACFKDDKTLYLNPGSCVRKRFSLPLTYMILVIDEKGCSVVKKELI